MTEDEAQRVARRIAGVEGYDRLVRLRSLVLTENRRHNLIARSTEPAIWARHIVDSIQLAAMVADNSDPWMDIGTGAGFPGLAIAALDPARRVTLVEPRILRATFLRRTAEELGLDHVKVVSARVETVRTSASVISARAVAPVEELLRAATQCATFRTRWLLFLGSRLIDRKLFSRRYPTMMFHVEQSITDPQCAILRLQGTPS